MKIKRALFTVDYSSFYSDDQQAIKNGIGHDGFIYTDDPVTPGFTSVRQADEYVSVRLILENGAAVVGGCAAVQYSDTDGCDLLFLAENFIPSLNDHIKPLLEGCDIDSFLTNTRFFGELRTDGRLLHTAIRYGLSQALLGAAALATGRLKAEVVCDEWQLPCAPKTIPLFGQSGDGRYIAIDEMALKGMDVLSYTLVNDVEEKLGFKGERLHEYVRWLSNRVPSLRTNESYHLALHTGVYGTIGLTFDMDPVRYAEYIAGLEAEAQDLPLYVEDPVDAGNKPDRVRMLIEITQELTRLGPGVKVIADEWRSTYQDIVDFTNAGSCHMVQTKTPDLGDIHDTVNVALYCDKHGMEAYQGGTCSETEVSARTCVHVVLVARPIRMLIKPGMGFDEGLNIVFNEMNRAIALL